MFCPCLLDFLSSLLVCCRTCVCNDIIHSLVFSSTPPRSKGEVSAQDLMSKFSPFRDTYLVISPYSLSEAFCLICPFYRQTLWISHQHLPLDQIKRKWIRSELSFSLSLNTHNVILMFPWWNLFTLSLLFVPSPCESRDEILFKGSSLVTP